MATPQEELKAEQETDQYSQYLESPKAFHLDMPLYHDFDLSVKSCAEKVFSCISHSDTIDAYCVFCKKDSAFGTKVWISETPYGGSLYQASETELDAWLKRGDGIKRVVHSCTTTSVVYRSLPRVIDSVGAGNSW